MNYYKIIFKDSKNMSEVGSDSVDLIITSPPYFNLVEFTEDTEGDLSLIKDKFDFFDKITDTWRECYRVLKNGGYLVCEFEDYPVGSRYIGYPWEILLAGDMNKSIEDVGFRLISRQYIKKFETGVALSKFQYTSYQNIFECKVDPRAIANVAYSFVYKKGTVMRKRKCEFTRDEWITFTDGMWRIEFISGGVEGISGGAVFPDEYVRRILKVYSSEGDVVLDPFLGTGTTMKVCFEMRRNCIGYELNKNMKDIIMKKVSYGARTLLGDVKWEVIE